MQLDQSETLTDLLSLLFPKKTEGNLEESRKAFQEFYEPENITPILDYVIKEFEKSVVIPIENKGLYIIYLINTAKEIYIRMGEYDKASSVFKNRVLKFFDSLILEGERIEDSLVILLIYNELLAAYCSQQQIEKQLYEVLKLTDPAIMEDLVVYNGLYHVFEIGDKECSLSLGDSNKFVNAYLHFLDLLNNSNECDLFTNHLIACVKTHYEISRYFGDGSLESSFNTYEIMNNLAHDIIFIQPFIKYFQYINKLEYENKVEGELTLNKTKSKELVNNYFSLMKNTIDYNSKKGMSEIEEKLQRDVISEFEDLYLSADNQTMKNILPNYALKVLDASDTRIKEKLIDFLVERFEDLYEDKQYQIISRMHQIGVIPMGDYFFETAYSLSHSGYRKEAKEIYEQAIIDGNESVAVYNNLGVYYREVENNLEKAVVLYQKALKLDPEDKTVINNLKSIEKAIKEEKEKPKRVTENYFKKTKTWHKQILFSIYRIGEQEVSIEMLSGLTKQSPTTLKKNLDYLASIELISFNGTRIIMDPTVEKLVGDYINPKLEREILKIDKTKYFRPIFYHESEISLYRALIELFPQHFIFPNMSLKTIFDIEKLKDIIDGDHINYLFMAHVDFVIINTTTYLPVLAFEKDSDYNDTKLATENTKKKNLIFTTGGIPLIRLRFNSAMDLERLKSEVRMATKELLSQIQGDSHLYEVNLFEELDVKKFGISITPVDIEEVKSEWEKIVGKMVAGQSKIAEIDGDVLQVQIATELVSVIELGRDNIRDKISQKFPSLRDINYLWY
ncbi:DciA family protein [Brevibacillus sp. M2.1A]|uniref:DUF2726 domain-containing protein n=1 Tax=Brevibacillus sp. M2.1A TaxID=2738980 RepID=UPI00156B5B5A|nr:DUF2726 domain-containing protein [Brevibacillus sp. M2.1A]MCC8438544.1 DciA family protein [Brevibacillus sp. M2.1A]